LAAAVCSFQPPKTSKAWKKKKKKKDSRACKKTKRNKLKSIDQIIKKNTFVELYKNCVSHKGYYGETIKKWSV